MQSGAIWGISHFLRLSHAAAFHELPISVVGHGSNPAVAAAAAAVPNHLTTEVQHQQHGRGIGVDQVIADGGIVLGDQPGSGITVDEAALVAPAAERGWGNSDGPHVRPVRAGLRVILDGVER